MLRKRGSMTTPVDTPRPARSGNLPLVWGIIWGGTMLLLWGWLVAYLNAPARHQYQAAVATTFLGAAAVVLFSFLLGWACAMILHAADIRGRR
jgi:ABC-type sulfate transport system permease component